VSVSTQHLTQLSGNASDATPQQHRQGSSFHPLLKMQIAPRLALGFLIPLLVAVLAIGNVGLQDQQLQARETLFYGSLVQGNILLHNAIDDFDQLRSNLLGLLSDAGKPGTSLQTLTEDYNAIALQTGNIDAALNTYMQQDVFGRYSDLSDLFAQTGHSTLIKQQQVYAGRVMITWHNYVVTQQRILNYLDQGDTGQANLVEQKLSEQQYADSVGSLLQLLQFNKGLTIAINDAIRVEQNQFLWTTITAGLSILLGIAIVGWLVFVTLVRRLQRLRRVVNSIEKGNVEARLEVVGNDEIARVSSSINDMLDTIVGLLDETWRQRNELAYAEELKQLHRELQSKHEALNAANARLAALVTSDPLTGLPNHRTVINRLEEEISRCERSQQTCAVLFIDLDHFKQINDNWGHRAGDAVLCEIGQRLSKAIRLEDFVGRYGGEEFAVILTDVTLDEARQTAERLQHVLAAEPVFWQADDESQSTFISITGSIGVALLNTHGNTTESLIEAADAAMYHAKHTGRNCVCVSGEEKLYAQVLLEESADKHTPDTHILQVLTAVINAHDGNTGAHSIRMVRMAKETARQLGCAEEEVQLVRLAALLHDVGKVSVPHEILHKRGPLTDDEWSVIRRHPKTGRQILAQAGGKFELLSRIVVAHHERWDGKGYPYGLSGETIPLGARILAVADSFDAMTSDRPYRKALPVVDAIEELQRCTGDQYDPRVVAAFLHVLAAQEQAKPDESLVVMP
jgi:diguanylate cyclase (GGDEF)-like protein/putative nucleotidyltransferase with HDIG domain